MRVLLIEDDELVTEMLVPALTSQHHVVDMVTDGLSGLDYAQSTPYDLIVMDVGLPQMDGISVCQRLRSAGCATPILLITAKDATSDRIRGLDAGADDYLTKPLNLAELQARVRALLRRGETPRTPVLERGALRLDPVSCKVTYDEQPLVLTPKEYSLLELLLRHPTRVFSRGDIIEHLWTYDDPPQEESVKAHIKGLRQKLKAVGAADWIENVYGLGYRLRDGLATSPAQDTEAPTVASAPVSEAPATAAQSPPASVEQRFNQAVDDLWARSHGLMTERLAVLQQMAIALQAGRLTPELRHAAEQAAHKLAGVLGMFDREEGTQIARQLEQQLAAEATLLPEQQTHVIQGVQALHDLLHLPVPVVLTPLSTRASAPKTGDRPLQATLLAVDDDPIVLSALPSLLEPWGFRVIGLDDPRQFWHTLEATQPDLLMLDVEMPHHTGIELCQAIRQHADWQGLPVLVLTAHQESETVQQVFSAGADDYITKPVVGAELLTRITNRLERMRLWRSLSTRDPLTGVMNQPQSNRALEALLHQAEHNQTAVTLLLLNAVELRSINMQYGHDAGNQVLQRWGTMLQRTFGEEVVGYWGNGEFVVGLAGVTRADLQSDSERGRQLTDLLTMLRQQIYTTTEGDRFQAICSFAIADFPADGQTVKSLYRIASTLLREF